MVKDFIAILLVIEDAYDYVCGEWLFVRLAPILLLVDLATDYYFYRFDEEYESEQERIKASKSFKNITLIKIGFFIYLMWSVLNEMHGFSIRRHGLLYFMPFYYSFVLFKAVMFVVGLFKDKKGRADNCKGVSASEPESVDDEDDDADEAVDRFGLNLLGWVAVAPILLVALFLILLITDNLDLISGVKKITDRESFDQVFRVGRALFDFCLYGGLIVFIVKVLIAIFGKGKRRSSPDSVQKSVGASSDATLQGSSERPKQDSSAKQA